MAKQGISTGTNPNDGTGDSLLDGAVKINSNFDEIYTTIGDGSTLSTPVTSITAGDNITVTASTGNITITGVGTADIDTDRINVSGVVTANSFSGSASGLTNIPAGNLSGTLPALDGSALTGVTASGVGVTVQDGGSGKGTASIINFGANLSVTTVNSGIATITAGAANTANLNSDTIVVGVLTATTFAGDLTLNTGDLLLSAGGINATTSSENLHWGSGNFYFNSGSPELAWIGNSGIIRAGAGGAGAGIISIKVGNPGENSGVFREGGAAELYYDNSKKFETTGSGTTTYGTALTQQLNVTGVSTFVGNANFNNVYLGDADKIYLGDSNDLELYHGGSLDNHGYLKSNNGNLYLTSASNGSVHLRGYNKDNLVVQSSSVQIFYNESLKVETTEQGVGVSGTITVSGQSLVSGISTFESALNADAGINVGSSQNLTFGSDFNISSNGTDTATIHYEGADSGDALKYRAGKHQFMNEAGSATFMRVTADGPELLEGGYVRLQAVGHGVTITGGVFASGISTFANGTIHIGESTPDKAGSSMIIGGNNETMGINFTGSNSTDLNSTYYKNIRVHKQSDFKYNLEFHSNGYSAGDVGDFIFYRRQTSFGRTERMRLEGETGNLTLTGTSSGGICSATSFYGDGSDLADGKWTLGANGSSDYTFTGIGFTQTTNDPILYLARGRVYEFVNTMGAHPFEIRESAGGSAFDRGVTNNAVSNGTLRFEIPFDAPNTLYYQCTSHSGMGSTIVVYPNTI